MPRKARKKTRDSIFHVTCKSIKEAPMFASNTEKEEFLNRVLRFKKVYNFKIYAYCIMDNHAHMIIDANGADISDIMHSINFSYVLFYNKNHNRKGHLLQERFWSEIVDSDNYLMATSVYIHGNPSVIKGYENCPEKYAYSSLSAYFGLEKDDFGLIDIEFVLSLFGRKSKVARMKYLKLVKSCNDKIMMDKIEFENQPTEYQSERKVLLRDVTPEEIIKYVSSKLCVNETIIHMKYRREGTVARAVCILLLRGIADYSCKEVCRIVGNIGQSQVATLTKKAVQLLKSDCFVKMVVEDFLLINA